MKTHTVRQTFVTVLVSAMAPVLAVAQTPVLPQVVPESRLCAMILVGADRTPVQQYLRLSLIARDGTTDENLSGKQRKALENILAEWHQRLELAPPRAFTDTAIVATQLFQPITKSDPTPDPKAVLPMAPNVVSHVEAVLLENGQVIGAVLKDSSLWPVADSMLLSNLQRHVPSTAFATAARTLTKDSIAIRVLTSVQPGASSHGVQVALQTLSLPLFAGTPVSVHRDNRGGPLYPEEMRRKSIPGKVLVQFYVSARGYPEEQTFKVLKASDGRFVGPVRAGVASMRFVPATVNGCAVRQMVQQEFGFSIR